MFTFTSRRNNSTNEKKKFFNYLLIDNSWAMTTKDTKVPKLRFNKKMFTVCQKLLIWVFSYVDPTVIVETFTPYLHNFYFMFFWFPPYILVLKYFCMSILYYFFSIFAFLLSRSWPSFLAICLCIYSMRRRIRIIQFTYLLLIVKHEKLKPVLVHAWEKQR